VLVVDAFGDGVGEEDVVAAVPQRSFGCFTYVSEIVYRSHSEL